jgi:hypothetical protein
MINGCPKPKGYSSTEATSVYKGPSALQVQIIPNQPSSAIVSHPTQQILFLALKLHDDMIYGDAGPRCRSRGP